MTIEDENLRKLKEAYKLWDETKAGSIQVWFDLMAEDIHWNTIGDEGKPYCCSKDEAKQYFNGFCADWEMNYYKTDEFIVQGDRIVMLGSCSWRNRKTGKTLETPKADFFKFKDGEIVEFFEFFDTQKTISANTDD